MPGYPGDYLTFHDGTKFPQMGFGTWKISLEDTADVVYSAIKEGYRHIDCAQDYANEKQVGEGVRRAIKDGIVTRKELFLTSKLWNTFHSPENVVKFCKKSLADWGVDYFDLFLVHFPIAQKYVDPSERYPPGLFTDEAAQKIELEPVPIYKTWAAFESLVDQGLVKNIGLSNFTVALVNDLLTYARIKPALWQIEHHPYLTQLNTVKYGQSQGIVMLGYSTFGPRSYEELDRNDEVREIPSVLKHPVVEKIAKAHNVSAALVILRWVTQRGIACIPKTVFPNELKENLKAFTFNLTEDEIKEINKLDRHARFNNPIDWPTVPIFD